MTDEEKVLPKEDALALARQGKEVWNRWAEENPGVGIDFSGLNFTTQRISFAEFIFPGFADFSFTTFKFNDFSSTEFSGGYANFFGAKFASEDANFFKAEFSGGNVDFRGAEVNGGVANFFQAKFSGGYANFQSAKFKGGSADFREAKFSKGRVIFDGVEFSGGHADFRGVEFIGGDVFFRHVSFSGGNVYFSRSIFSKGNVSFHATVFSKITSFASTKLKYKSDFTAVVFEGPIDLDSSYFAQVPDFRRSKLSAHFTLHDMKVDYSTRTKKVWGVFSKAATDSDADKFRRLKELAVQSRDHEREQDFFAKELKAKRYYETTGLSLIPSYLYEWTSDFGRSLWRPALCLGLTWLIFGLMYGVNGLPYATSVLDPLWNGLKLSLATLVPFAAISRTAMLESREALFRSDVNHLLDFAMVVEGVLAVIFIFLIGLALRNRFRI
ncbi:pentapeptide repeat-containing protein [Sneathiella sp.]|uniref:pentapeptide repeat-containing protein n=1 Tax=Sneathiella sp. TaxID=1964365 RepID=UPI0026130F9C|nr:pentapeptide repeat-containing protein [Sneathiella sp.]MDF2368006.1 pentapeptide repeat-containing protein [Sneathiella sp.]